MATWRKKASSLFPHLKREMDDREFSIYMLFFELLSMLREAHKAGDDDSIRKIYGFGEWCLQQKAKDLWNAAGVAFYEHLVDDPKLWPKIVPWLSPNVIDAVRGLWEARLDPEARATFDKLIRERKNPRYQELKSTE